MCLSQILSRNDTSSCLLQTLCCTNAHVFTVHTFKPCKVLLQNASQGEFSRERVSGKRIIELGAGMGLGGLAFALLGCKEVVLTDVSSVLPLLQKNVEANLPSIVSTGRSLVYGPISNHTLLKGKIKELTFVEIFKSILLTV